MKYPVAVASSAVVLFNSVIALLILLGLWNLTVDQLAQVNIIGTNFIAFVGAFYAHQSVTPVSYTKDTLTKGTL